LNILSGEEGLFSVGCPDGSGLIDFGVGFGFGRLFSEPRLCP